MRQTLVRSIVLGVSAGFVAAICGVVPAVAAIWGLDAAHSAAVSTRWALVVVIPAVLVALIRWSGHDLIGSTTSRLMTGGLSGLIAALLAVNVMETPLFAFAPVLLGLGPTEVWQQASTPRMGPSGMVLLGVCVLAGASAGALFSPEDPGK